MTHDPRWCGYYENPRGETLARNTRVDEAEHEAGTPSRGFAALSVLSGTADSV